VSGCANHWMRLVDGNLIQRFRGRHRPYAKIVFVNPVLLKAFAIREAIALVLVAVLIISIPRSPSLAVEALFFGPVATLLVIVTIISDRKLALRAGRGDDPWNGPYVAWNQLTWPTLAESPAALGVRAISNVGGRDAGLVRETTAVGWVGSNFPLFQEFQLAVEASTESPGQTLFTCCARPRWSPPFLMISMTGLQNRRLVDSLRAELQRLIA
jgi:hypothetical protein